MLSKSYLTTTGITMEFEIALIISTLFSYPDMYNCRKYFHCYSGGKNFHHFQQQSYAISVCVCVSFCLSVIKDRQLLILNVKIIMFLFLSKISITSTLYLSFYEGQEDHVTCPNGELYNAEDIMCDFPDRVDCGGR